MTNLFIYGAGGLGKEILDLAKSLRPSLFARIFFLDTDKSLINKTVAGIEVKHPDFFKPQNGSVVIAIGDPESRYEVAKSMPDSTQFINLIHPSANIGRNVNIGKGAIICAGSTVSCDTKLGDFAQINFNCTVGHDCVIGDYFTAAPGVNISGNVSIGDKVYCGTQVAFKQGISIANEVVIGMSSAVIRDVLEEGVTIYGNPARVIIKSKNQ